MEADFDQGEDEADRAVKRRTLAGSLSFYRVIKEPPTNEWHKLGEFGSPPTSVRMSITQNTTKEEEKEGDKKKNIENTTLHFKSKSGNAIDDFVDTAYQWYLGELTKLDDHSRFYYEMNAKVVDASGGNKISAPYRRYRLSEDKTFDSLFFQEKDNLLSLIDNFLAKSGKYGVKGFPHKLGVLLHGPPGTGK